MSDAAAPAPLTPEAEAAGQDPSLASDPTPDELAEGVVDAEDDE